MPNDRIDDVIRFYELLAELEDKIGGKPCLSKCRNGVGWGSPGVYFFFERGEYRLDSGRGERVVRVGCTRTDRPLCERFNNHRTGGSHRNSQFRLVIGSALKNRNNLTVPSWAVFPATEAEDRFKLSAQERRQQENTLEIVVSKYIEDMPFLWLVVEKESDRQLIESNSIALLSNCNRSDKIDSPSDEWLGFASRKPKICASGLWCEIYVTRKYERRLLEIVAEHVNRHPPGGCMG